VIEAVLFFHRDEPEAINRVVAAAEVVHEELGVGARHGVLVRRAEGGSW